MFPRKTTHRTCQWTAAALLIICLLLTGCGNRPAEQSASLTENTPEETSAAAEPAVQQEPLVLRCALSVPFEHPEAQALFRMQKALEEASGGRLRIDISTDGALAETDEVALEKVREGQLEMALVSSAALRAIAPDFAVFSVPFQIDSPEHMHCILTSGDPVLSALYAEAETGGVAVLSAFAALPTGFFLREATPEDPAAWNGLRLAVMDSASAGPLAAAGAVILDLPESAVYPMLLTGELDGAEGDMYTWLQDVYYAEAPYYVNLSFHAFPDLLIVNIGTMEKRTEAEKKLLWQLADEAAADSYAETVSLTETLAEQAVESGVVILEADPAAFRDLYEEELRSMRDSSPIAEALVALIENTR